MSLKKTLAVLAVSALILAAGFGLFAFYTANAQEPTPTAPDTAEPNANDSAASSETLPEIKGHGFRREIKAGVSREDLANALGITVDELNTAYETATNAALDQAVQDGLLTQAQADEIRARGANVPFGGRWGGWLGEQGIDYQALLADALGISVDELQQAYVQAYNARIDAAVAAGNLTQEQADLMKGRYSLFNNQGFQTAMQSAFEAAVQQAVTDGVITQAQADAILQNSGGMKWGGFPGGHGLMGGPGRHGGEFGWHGSEELEPPADTMAP